MLLNVDSLSSASPGANLASNSTSHRALGGRGRRLSSWVARRIACLQRSVNNNNSAGLIRLVHRPSLQVQPDTMEDETLLFLIYQHLKVRGYDKAAKVLENHVSQVSSPVPVWIHILVELVPIRFRWVQCCVVKLTLLIVSPPVIYVYMRTYF